MWSTSWYHQLFNVVDQKKNGNKDKQDLEILLCKTNDDQNKNLPHSLEKISINQSYNKMWTTKRCRSLAQLRRKRN